MDIGWIFVLKKRVLIVINNDKLNHELGVSLIEVLVASLLFAIVVLGLLDFQAVLIAQNAAKQDSLHAEQIAFELLDSYPNLATEIIPNDWQYNISIINQSGNCQIRYIDITASRQQQISQQRWQCN